MLSLLVQSPNLPVSISERKLCACHASIAGIDNKPDQLSNSFSRPLYCAVAPRCRCASRCSFARSGYCNASEPCRHIGCNAISINLDVSCHPMGSRAILRSEAPSASVQCEHIPRGLLMLNGQPRRVRHDFYEAWAHYEVENCFHKKILWCI